MVLVIGVWTRMWALAVKVVPCMEQFDGAKRRSIGHLCQQINAQTQYAQLLEHYAFPSKAVRCPTSDDSVVATH